MSSAWDPFGQTGTSPCLTSCESSPGPWCSNSGNASIRRCDALFPSVMSDSDRSFYFRMSEADTKQQQLPEGTGPGERTRTAGGGQRNVTGSHLHTQWAAGSFLWHQGDYILHFLFNLRMSIIDELRLMFSVAQWKTQVQAVCVGGVGTVLPLMCVCVCGVRQQAGWACSCCHDNQR